MGRSYDKDMRALRTLFYDIKVPVARVATNHTHGPAASARTEANTLMLQYTRMLGKEPYFYQCSDKDRSKQFDGSREYYWAKDATVSPSRDYSAEKHVLCLIDVDYYLDMPEFMATHYNPILIYTIIPETAGCVAAHAPYCFHKDNTIEMTVSGGATYRHELWNYSHDTVTVRHWYTTVVYCLEKKRITDDRYLILMTPIIYWPWYLYPFTLALEHNTLSRLNVVDGEFARLRIARKEGLFVSTCLLGAFNSATVPIAADDSVRAALRTSKTALTPPMIQGLEGVLTRETAMVLVDYHRSKSPIVPPTVFPVSEGVREYQAIMPGAWLNFDARTGLKPFMSPIVHGAYSPVKSKSNDLCAVKFRITDVQSDVPMTPQLLNYMNEFIELAFKRHKHTLDPYDVDEVYARQNRPSQKHKLDEGAATVNARRKVDSFLKSECYGKLAPPRLIATINGKDKLEYAQFIYKCSDLLKNMIGFFPEFPWYAFGHSPIETARRIAAICMACLLHILKTDASKFDGRYSLVLRVFERLILMYLFKPQYHEELVDLHKATYNMKATTTEGVKFATLYVRNSGENATAFFNTTSNSFINYVGFRLAGYSPEEAYAKLGSYGGDDGLTGDLPFEMLAKAGRMVGQEITGVVVRRGEMGVSFLARMYSPYVWWGDLNSCCDIPRQLCKFHVSTLMDPNIPATAKLLAKSLSFIHTDQYTPVIGELVSKAVQLRTAQDDKIQELWSEQLANIRYTEPLASEGQYPNENDGWMDAYFQQSMPNFDLALFRGYLDRVRNLDHMLTFPLCQDVEEPAPGPVPMVLGDRIVSPVPVPTTAVKMVKRAMCTYHAAGKCTKADKCTFAHDKKELVPPDCRNGTKCTHKGCKFNHPEEVKTEPVNPAFQPGLQNPLDAVAMALEPRVGRKTRVKPDPEIVDLKPRNKRKATPLGTAEGKQQKQEAYAEKMVAFATSGEKDYKTFKKHFIPAVGMSIHGGSLSSTALPTVSQVVAEHKVIGYIPKTKNDVLFGEVEYEMSRPTTPIPTQAVTPGQWARYDLVHFIVQLVATHSTSLVVTMAPVYEEWAKKWYPKFSFLIVLLETATNCRLIGRGALMTFVMHAFAAFVGRYNLGGAIAIHAFWNNICVPVINRLALIGIDQI